MEPEQPYKIYKTGISFGHNKTILFLWPILAVIFSFFIYTVVPYPFNSMVFVAVISCMIFILLATLLLNKFVMGTHIKMYKDKICIYKPNAFSMKPADNELLLSFTQNNGYIASVVLTYSNIVSIRKVSREEVRELSDIKINNVQGTIGVRVAPLPKVSLPINKQRQLLLKFVCDYNNVVEITTKELTEPDTSLMTGLKTLAAFSLQLPKIQVANEKILVSINNPDDFVEEIREKSA